MIVVDTSVWVDHLNDTPTPQVVRLRDIIMHGLGRVVVGDLVMCEILQGLANEREAALVEGALRRFTVEAMVSPPLACRAAAHYRTLRARGITVRKTMDMLIGTYCIAHRHALLHSDRDFDPMEQHLGLSVLHP